MGKKGGTSWLHLVKKAFRPSSKERKEHKQGQEKKKWAFGRLTNQQVVQCEAKLAPETATSPIIGAREKHAFAVAAAEAALATAQAAVEIVRLTRPPCFMTNDDAAIVIQTTFRGYLARRALRALKGLVKLQALVRGQNVRRKAEVALNCIRALVRLQGKMQDQRARLSLSHQENRRSMFAETTKNLWDDESRYFQDIGHRLSVSRRDGSCIEKNGKEEAALRREKSLAYAFSNQIWRAGRHSSFGEQKELEERTRWFDRWMAAKQWDHISKGTSMENSERIKTIKIDAFNKPSPPPRSQYIKQSSPRASVSPTCKTSNSFLHRSPITPPPSEARSLNMRSMSPRCLHEQKCHSEAQTPSLSSPHLCRNANTAPSAIPNYMAATESAKARIGSRSAPKQRPSMPERVQGGLVKKRLSFPIPEPETYEGTGDGCSSFSQDLRSPSLKSTKSSYYTANQQPSMCFCSVNSHSGEITPSSAFELRRW